jgi:xylulose-5-phosphate/fructose-6-phosphate phosphoketolase
VKPRLLGHWGTTPGLNLIYAHLNRVIRNWDLNVIYIAGPGHGGPGIVANTYLEGTYTERYPSITQDAEGMRRLFRQFSFPGGIPSHVAPETPGSIHEGGELGYWEITAPGAAARAFVIAAREDKQIAAEVRSLLPPRLRAAHRHLIQGQGV